jgi:hypothetical protein
MYLSKFVHTDTGKYMMSILLGIGLATFFRQMCEGKNCLIYNAPPIEEIDDTTYKFDDKCYKMTKTAVKCNSKKEILPFA